MGSRLAQARAVILHKAGGLTFLLLDSCTPSQVAYGAASGCESASLSASAVRQQHITFSRLLVNTASAEIHKIEPSRR